MDRAPLPTARRLLATLACAAALAAASLPPAAAAPPPAQDPPPAAMIPLTPEEVRTLAAKPWLTPTPPPPVPAQLQGMILFRSDLAIEDPYDAALCREDASLCDVYALDPANGALWLLADPQPYACAEGRDALSANRHYRAFVQSDWIEFASEYGPFNELQLQIKYYDRQFQAVRTLSHFGARFFGPGFQPFGDSWDPAWSPAGDEIAFVSNDSGNDEIYAVTKDRWPPRQLTRNDWPGDKHPSWSPNGRQLAFESNRDGQHRIWTMNADGSSPRALTDPLMNAFAPVWVKYVGADGCP